MVNKKGSLVTDKPAYLIIGIVVLVIVLGFLFYFNENIISLIGNLIPDFYVGDNSQVIGDLKADEKIKSICGIFVGYILKDRIYICSSFDDEVCKNAVKTNLLWDGDSSNADIEISGLVGDEIGSVSEGKVVLNKEVLFGGELYNKNKDKLPTLYLLNNLDGAFYAGNNWICRDEIKILDNDEMECIYFDNKNQCEVLEGCWFSEEDEKCLDKIQLENKNWVGDVIGESTSFYQGSDVKNVFIDYDSRNRYYPYVYYIKAEGENFWRKCEGHYNGRKVLSIGNPLICKIGDLEYSYDDEKEVWFPSF